MLFSLFCFPIEFLSISDNWSSHKLGTLVLVYYIKWVVDWAAPQFDHVMLTCSSSGSHFFWGGYFKENKDCHSILAVCGLSRRFCGYNQWVSGMNSKTTKPLSKDETQSLDFYLSLRLWANSKSGGLVYSCCSSRSSKRRIDNWNQAPPTSSSFSITRKAMLRDSYVVHMLEWELPFRLATNR